MRHTDFFTAQPSEGKLVEQGHFSVLGGNEVTDTRQLKGNQLFTTAINLTRNSGEHEEHDS